LEEVDKDECEEAEVTSYGDSIAMMGDTMMDEMIFLGYSCPKCGTIGFYDSVCATCERGPCFKGSSAKSVSKAEYTKGFEEWKRRQPAGAKVSRADYRGTLPTVVTATSKSAQQTWEWLANNQQVVLAHRAYDRSA
jgi:uncharacterized Zn finger protein (UPF0148 family)